MNALPFALLTTAPALDTAIRSIGQRSSTLRKDIHVAVLSALAYAENAQDSAPLAKLVSKLIADAPTCRAVVRWINTMSLYHVAIKTDSKTQVQTVECAFIKAADERAAKSARYSAATDDGLIALNSLPYYAPKPKPALTEKSGKGTKQGFKADDVRDAIDAVLPDEIAPRQAAAIVARLIAKAVELDADAAYAAMQDALSKRAPADAAPQSLADIAPKAPRRQKSKPAPGLSIAAQIARLEAVDAQH